MFCETPRHRFPRQGQGKIVQGVQFSEKSDFIGDLGLWSLKNTIFFREKEPHIQRLGQRLAEKVGIRQDWHLEALLASLFRCKVICGSDRPSGSS